MAVLFRADGWVKSVLGQAIAGAQIYVCTQPADTAFIPPVPLASVFADPAGLVPITQPVISDGFGHYDYYAASEAYTVVIVNGGNVQQVYPDQVPMGAALGGGSGGGTVTNNEGPLTANSLILGNGGDDVLSGPVFPGDPTRFLNGAGAFTVPAGGAGTVTSIAAGTGLTASPSPITGSGTISITNTAVTPGSYTFSSITVNQQGQITAASNGSVPTQAFVQIAEVILLSDSATISFSSIPATHRNLMIILTGRSSDTNTAIYAQFNGDTGANYSTCTIDGGSSAPAGSGSTGQSKATIGFIEASSISSGAVIPNEITIYDYARTQWNKYATCVAAEVNSVTQIVLSTGFSWNNTAAINAILIGKVAGGNIAAGTVATLYGF